MPSAKGGLHLPQVFVAAFSCGAILEGDSIDFPDASRVDTGDGGVAAILGHDGVVLFQLTHFRPAGGGQDFGVKGLGLAQAGFVGDEGVLALEGVSDARFLVSDVVQAGRGRDAEAGVDGPRSGKPIEVLLHHLERFGIAKSAQSSR